MIKTKYDGKKIEGAILKFCRGDTKFKVKRENKKKKWFSTSNR